MKIYNPETIIREYFNLLKTQDFDKAVSLISDNIDWDIPGDSTLAPWLGKRVGKKGVREFYATLFGNINEGVYTINHIFVDGDKAIVEGNISSIMLKTNKQYKTPFYLSITVEEGKITRYFLLEDTLQLTKILT